MFETTNRGVKSEVAFSAAALRLDGDGRKPRVGCVAVEPEREQRRSVFHLVLQRAHTGRVTVLIADIANARVKLVTFDANDEQMHMGTVYTCAPDRQLGVIELLSERGFLAIVESAARDAMRWQDLVVLAPPSESFAHFTDLVSDTYCSLCSHVMLF